MWILLFFITCSTIEAGHVSFSPQIITYKDTDWLTVSYKNDPGWHTYWKNPGDAGLPPSWNFYIEEKEIFLSSLEWPVPKRFFEKKGLITFGYEGEYSFFFPLDKNIAKVAGNLRVKSRYLVCKDVCIPGKGEMSVGEGSFRISREELIRRMDERPRSRPFPKELTMELVLEQGEKMAFYYELNHMASLEKPLLIPFPHPLLGFKKESLFQGEKGKIHGRYTLDWEGEYADEPVSLPTHFSPPLEIRFLYFNPIAKKVEVVEKKVSSFGSGEFKKKFSFFSNNLPKNSSFFIYILAFFGGLILNIMPCVFPVIMLKLFSLIKNKEINRKIVFKNNMLYTGGVLFSFLILAVIVISIKSGGEQIGWGFQLQSPGFVTVIIMCLFLFSLNLFGLFEIKIPWSNSLGGMSTKGHPLEYFFNGVLSTILATPCSAPFLGSALTFAFTGSPLDILLVFLSIGLGLSFPFIIESIFPGVISFCLPRPGAWMDHVKKFLGLVLLIVIIWLLDVFSSQVEENIVSLLHLGLAFLFFAVYGCSRMFSSFFSKAFLISLPFLCFITMWFSFERVKKEFWHPWNLSSLEQHQKKEDWVFMNFTAKWCLTCKMNTPLFESRKFALLMEKYNVIPLKADWTRRDPVIGEWLQQQNVAGIPAYFIQTPKGEVINLGETISLEEIESYIIEKKLLME